MARLPRLVVPGLPHHVLQRGNNRQPVFVDDTDRHSYLEALREATRLHGVNVHAYVLMPNHVHLLVTPASPEALAKAMQTLGRRYVRGFNRRHQRSGTLWEGRFRTCVLEDADCFLPVLRYIEQHPARGSDGPLGEAAGYRWSSAAHHLGQRRDPLVSEHALYWATGNTPFEREAKHRALLSVQPSSEELQRLRHHVHTGWPLLSEQGGQALASRTDRRIEARSPGRPRGAKSLPKQGLVSVPN
jgi:putative transposase